MTLRERLYEPSFTLFRVFTGAMFASHGAQKLLGFFGGTKVTGLKLVTAGALELGGGVLIAVGLFTSVAAFIVCGEMAVAYFMAHAPQGFWPIVNHGELAVLYCFTWLFVWTHGPGRWSLDAVIRGRSGGRHR